MKTKYIIFDLDDTLAYEIDYLKSAYVEISEFLDKKNSESLYQEMINQFFEGKNVFELLLIRYPSYKMDDLLNIYRNHFPNIQKIDGADELLSIIKSRKHKLGLITDGRSVTQRNKLKALGIENLFDKIIVSEEFGSTKPNENNFTVFIEDSIKDYYYIADNPKKDFITPNKLGWNSVCLLNKGSNIHQQNFNIPNEYLPTKMVNSLIEIIDII